LQHLSRFFRILYLRENLDAAVIIGSSRLGEADTAGCTIQQAYTKPLFDRFYTGGCLLILDDGTHFKMSMLQDFERHRTVEIGALVGAVQELARLKGVATPTIDVLLALVEERATNEGLYERLMA
jgi:Ketopantoate reductase PanE/ApbA C terminal